MHSSIAIRCLDKNVSMVLSQLFHRSHGLKNVTTTRKPPPFLTLKNNFTYILNNIIDKQIGDSSLDLHQSLRQNAVGTAVAVKTIRDSLQINHQDAVLIVNNNPAFNHVTRKQLADNCLNLTTAGMTLSSIKKNVDLLIQDSDNLHEKLKKLLELSDNINDALPLLYHNLDDINLFVNSLSHFTGNDSIENKVQFYSCQWKVKNSDLFHIISKYLNQMTADPKNTAEVIKLLLENKVTLKNLLSKNWNVRINSEVAQKRIQKISQFGLLKSMKLWVLKYNDTEFKRKIENSKNKSTKHNQITKFLCKMSGYSKSVINSRLNICNLSELNLDQVNFLSNLIIEEGYDWHDIIWYAEVLLLPENLVIERFLQIKNVNYKPKSLDFLLLSNEDFNNYVKNCEN